MVGPLGRDRQAVKLARQANRKVANVDHFLDFAQALRKRLASFKGNKAPERLFVRAQHFTQAAHQFATHRCGHIAPD
jgi:predicted LPLAT superfamily acyltransferase